MPPKGESSEITEDTILGGRLRLRQPRTGHRFGHDAVLLGAAVPARPGDHVVEFGSGVGAAGLALAWRVDATSVTLVEREPSLVGLARENIAANGFAARVRAECLDVGSIDAAHWDALGLAPADHVLMNPPFNDARRGRPSPDPERREAHLASPDQLRSWIGAATRIIAPGGSLTLIWRSDGLPDALAALAAGWAGTTVLPVHPRPGEPAVRVIICSRWSSRRPFALLPPLYLQGEGQEPSAEAERVLRGGAALGLAALSP